MAVAATGLMLYRGWDGFPPGRRLAPWPPLLGRPALPPPFAVPSSAVSGTRTRSVGMSSLAAVQAFEVCVKKARELSVSCDWSSYCADQLKKIRPLVNKKP